MVKLAGPLMSLSAHGKLANTLNYSKRKSGNIGREFHYPKTPPTQAQYTRRTIIGLLTAHWQTMSAGDKATWNTNAKSTGLNISGFNYFIKLAIANLTVYHGLIGYWSLNELTGVTAYDYSGQGNDGTINDGVRIESINTKFGKAIAFNGASSWIDTGADMINTGNLTISLWVYLNSYGQGENAKILDNGKTRLYVNPDGGGRFRFTSDGATIINSGDNSATLNSWLHVAVARSATGSATFYRNSIRSGAAGQNSGSPVAGTTNVVIGNVLGGGQSTDGKGDEVRLYNRVLPATEIVKQYELLRLDKKRQPLLIH